MAKFCGNCGAQLDDDDKVCGQCGTPVNGNAGTVPGLKVVDPEKKKKMAKRIKWIVALVIVVALAITVVKVYLSFTGTNGLVRKVMTAYEDWETDVLNDSNQFKGLCDDAIENGVGTQDYVLPGSDMRYVSKEELKDFTAEQCRLARNELYARHGRIFDDEFLQTYFSSKDWYSPSIATADFKESMLNEYEIANRDLIVEYEKERGYR